MPSARASDGMTNGPLDGLLSLRGSCRNQTDHRRESAQRSDCSYHQLVGRQAANEYSSSVEQACPAGCILRPEPGDKNEADQNPVLELFESNDSHGARRR